MWKNGSTAMTRSPSRIATASSWQMFATRFRCVSITPLGSPVVPLEYGSATTSSAGASATRRRRRLLKLVGHRDQQPRAAGTQLACQLVGGQQRVGGRVDAADRRDCVER